MLNYNSFLMGFFFVNEILKKKTTCKVIFPSAVSQGCNYA